MLLQFWMIPLANFTSTWLEHVGTCSSLGDTPTCGHQNIWKTFFHKCVKLIMVFSSISSCPICFKSPCLSLATRICCFCRLRNRNGEVSKDLFYPLPVLDLHQAPQRRHPVALRRALEGQRHFLDVQRRRVVVHQQRDLAPKVYQVRQIMKQIKIGIIDLYVQYRIIMGAILIQSSNIYRIAGLQIKETLLTWRLRVWGWVKALGCVL